MILAIIQARMSSTRLPGKVLMPIAGKPMIKWVIDAALAAKLVDEAVVATSDRPDDEAIIDYVVEYVDVFPGDIDDVLDRFYQAALCHHPAHIVRLTADCPMSDPAIIDEAVRFHLEGLHDYTRNCKDGFDVEVFTYEALLHAAKLASMPHQREHVTPYMREDPCLVKGELYLPRNKSGKYSVDTEEDFERVEEEMLCLHARKNYLRGL